MFITIRSFYFLLFKEEMVVFINWKWKVQKQIYMEAFQLLGKVEEA